jgi:plasmid stability protein
MHTMDTTIRNIDEQAFRALKARAALEGKTVGEALNEAIRTWLAASGPLTSTASLRDLRPERWGSGSERLSEEINKIVYRGRTDRH